MNAFSKKKKISLPVNPELDFYVQGPLFVSKLEKANEILKKHGLPKEWAKPEKKE